MKKVLRDRKTLYFILSIMLVLVFTLSVAYAAMSAVLEIHGNSEVVASNWDVYFDSPNESVGGADYDWVPGVRRKTLSFNVTLNNPGDKLKFTIDIVNGGSIDAVIESIVKSPELTSEQAKYIKYEITYVDGTSINESQYLAVSSRKKVQVEVAYRNDISVSDLPSSATTLNLSIKLICNQASGNSSNDNSQKVVNVVSGDGTQVGNEVCISEECFYVISSTDTSVTMLSKYNLYVGNSVDSNWNVTPLENPTGIQDKSALGYFSGHSQDEPIIGSIKFSNSPYWSDTINSYPAYVYDSNSLLYTHIENYKMYLGTLGVTPTEARVISYDELCSLGCSNIGRCSDAPKWVYSTTYWIGDATSEDEVLYVYTYGYVAFYMYLDDSEVGVRPVITISRDYL